MAVHTPEDKVAEITQNQALLAKLRRLPQVHQRQGRGLPPMPTGTREIWQLQIDQELTEQQFFLAYRSLCPSAWVERWDDQRGKKLTEDATSFC